MSWMKEGRGFVRNFWLMKIILTGLGDGEKNIMPVMIFPKIRDEPATDEVTQTK